jgi:aryl-alcohol dehydrogenase-like predicted oxidoreductase
MKLNDYVTLGRSGLRVSPLCLGTMTFGTEWGWGAEEEPSRAMFNRYLEQGGNFIDTADGYTNGKSEQLVGKFLQETKSRDKVVLATKFTFNGQAGNPNANGNGRKNIYRAIEGSLRRLQTDYIDLYWMHAWDTITPVEEVIASLDTLVHAGKIRYYGFSDIPAWYLARAYTLAEQQGREKIVALQLEYSLVERNIEREHIPAAQEMGLGVCPWSPLANGLLAGKYKRDDQSGPADGRLEILRKSGGTLFERFTERNWKIVDALLEVSKQMSRPPAEVALNWVATQPGVTSTILGPRWRSWTAISLRWILLSPRICVLGSIRPAGSILPRIPTCSSGQSFRRDCGAISPYAHGREPTDRTLHVFRIPFAVLQASEVVPRIVILSEAKNLSSI